MTQSVTDENFQSEVLESDVPVIVDFWATWCKPCNDMMPYVEALSETVTGVKIVKVNIEEAPETPSKYGIRGVPTLMVFKDGQVTDTRVGKMSEPDLKNWVASVA